METTTPFDLNQAIQQWRDGLAQSPAIRGENLAELEVHLRDSVSALEAKGLAADEAFLVATKRAGSDTVLGKEFAKANPQSVWLDRVFWTLVLVQAWNALCNLGYSLVLATSRASSFNPSLRESELNSFLGFMAWVAIPLAGLFLAAMLAWRLLESPQGWVRKTLEYLSSRPWRLAVSLLALNLVTSVVLTMINFSLLNVGRGMVPWYYIRPLTMAVAFAVAVFFLARKRLLKKA